MGSVQMGPQKIRHSHIIWRKQGQFVLPCSTVPVSWRGSIFMWVQSDNTTCVFYLNKQGGTHYGLTRDLLLQLVRSSHFGHPEFKSGCVQSAYSSSRVIVPLFSCVSRDHVQDGLSLSRPYGNKAKCQAVSVLLPVQSTVQLKASLVEPFLPF